MTSSGYLTIHCKVVTSRRQGREHEGDLSKIFNHVIWRLSLPERASVISTNNYLSRSFRPSMSTTSSQTSIAMFHYFTSICHFPYSTSNCYLINSSFELNSQHHTRIALPETRPISYSHPPIRSFSRSSKSICKPSTSPSP